MDKYMKVQFKADLTNVALARGVIACFLFDNELTISNLNEIKTIISEGVTNAIVHGYQNDKVSIVTMILSLKNNVLKIEIIDEGIGIEDVEQARLPLFSSKLSEERAGLGFTIMDVFSDEMTVESELGKGTKISCVKKIA